MNFSLRTNKRYTLYNLLKVRRMEGDGLGEWQMVSRRKSPTLQSKLAAPPTVKPYIPYKPLYSHIVSPSSFPTSSASSNPNPQNLPNRTQMANTTPPSSPPPTQTTYYFSPHSPTKLRFPPSSQFTEWRGRCFCCCRTGHNQAQCRNPMRCGKCWGEGHVDHRCTVNVLNPAALPYWSNKTRKFIPQSTPSKVIDDLLLKPCPLAAPTMPSNRP